MEIPTPCFTTQRYPRQQEKNIFQHSKAFCCFRFPSSLDGESNASGIEVESDDGEKNLKRKRKYRIFPSASFHLVFTLISTFSVHRSDISPSAAIVHSHHSIADELEIMEHLKRVCLELPYRKGERRTYRRIYFL